MGHCEDCVRCTECGAVAYCLSEPHPDVTCPHDSALCGTCWPGNCVPCRLAAEAGMFASGEYDEAADPFVNHLVPIAPDPVAVDGGYWWDGSWVPSGPNPKAKPA